MLSAFPNPFEKYYGPLKVPHQVLRTLSNCPLFTAFGLVAFYRIWVWNSDVMYLLTTAHF